MREFFSRSLVVGLASYVRSVRSCLFAVLSCASLLRVFGSCWIVVRVVFMGMSCLYASLLQTWRACEALFGVTAPFQTSQMSSSMVRDMLSELAREVGLFDAVAVEGVPVLPQLRVVEAAYPLNRTLAGVMGSSTVQA